LGQLLAIGKNSTSLSLNYMLGKDINAIASSSWNGGSGWQPIGNSEKPFTGKIIGFNNEIEGININRPIESSVGMFGVVSDGSIQMLKLSGFNVNGATKVGALAGEAYNSNIGYINADADIKGISSVGGVAGYSSNSNFNKIDAKVNISAKDSYVGGVVGYKYGGYLNNSLTRGNIVGDFSPVMGGMVGYNESGWIGSSGSAVILKRNGLLSNNSENGIGGIVGYNKSGNVSFVVSGNNVSGAGYVGGLIGFNLGSLKNSSYDGVLNAYGLATNNIPTYAGGLIGYNSGSVFSSEIRLAKISGPMVGGLVGYNKGTLDGSSVFWNSPENLAQNLGGLVGINEGLIDSCDVGSIVGDALQAKGSIGGLVNYNMKNGIIKYSQIGGLMVVGKDNVGGLISVNEGVIVGAGYTLSNINVFGETNVGGLIGINKSSSMLSYFPAAASVNGINNVGGVIGLNTASVTLNSVKLPSTVQGSTNVGPIVGLNQGSITIR
jgi:hypothetical protein